MKWPWCSTQVVYLAVAEVAGEGSEIELQLLHIPLVVLQGQELPAGIYRGYNVWRMDRHGGYNVWRMDGYNVWRMDGYNVWRMDGYNVWRMDGYNVWRMDGYNVWRMDGYNVWRMDGYNVWRMDGYNVWRMDGYNVWRMDTEEGTMYGGWTQRRVRVVVVTLTVVEDIAVVQV